MVILRVITFILLTSTAFALGVGRIVVNCSETEQCKDFRKSVAKLKRTKLTKKGLKRHFRFLANKSYVESLYYELNNSVLTVDLVTKKRVKSISIKAKSNYEAAKVESVLALKEGDYYDEDLLEKTLDTLESMVINGDIDDYDISVKDVGQEIFLSIDLSKPSKKIFKAIKFDVTGEKPEFDFNAFWGDFIGEAWTKSGYKKRLDEFRDYIYELGFWNNDLESKIVNYDNYVVVKIKLNLGLRYGFNFNGNTYFSHRELVQEFKNLLKGRKKNLDTNLILQRLSAMYKKRGVYFSLFDVSEVLDFKKGIIFFFVNIKEGQNVDVADLIFNGNKHVKTKELKEVYNEAASDLLSRGYLDVDGLADVKKAIQKFYISKGFIFAEVSDPVVSFSNDKRFSYISYKISEDYQYKVRGLDILGIDTKYASKIMTLVHNKVGDLFNVDMVDNDLKVALNYVKSQGYFFAGYKTKKPKEIIKLDRKQRGVNVLLDFDLGDRAYLGDIIVTGNSMTKKKVIRRELQLNKGDLVTPQKINDFVKSLKQLGLFSSVKITPYIAGKRNDGGIDLNFIIKVKEKDFGKGEVAPGFRTDLGYKVSTTISYNNLMGMNRSAIVRVQGNLRTSKSVFDDRRQQEDKSVLEGLGELQFVEPYLFNLPVRAKLGLKYQRKRFFDFDADIMSITTNFNMSLNKFADGLSGGLKYEFDNVRQYDASDIEDSGRFQIGSITPSLTLDLLDKNSSLQKGAWYNLSWEFANPYFFSNDDPDLTINYNKAVFRSYFYKPFYKSKIVLATSLTAGIQKNFATDKITVDGVETTKGYIPSLKVFRLSGLDLLRGFSDDEANKLINGTDISDILVRGKAYLFNFKMEPRYYLSDNSVIGVFFDAGRIFVNTINFLDLRTSVGASFKFLTPIGSLNFDYGVKLKRDRATSGRESFGRFHVTIGQF